MGPANHVNAVDILPEEELRRLSDLLGGRPVYVWVPSRESLTRRRRSAYILALHEQGVTALEIAERLLLSVRQVRRVLAKNRAGGLPSGDAGHGGHQ